MIKIVLIIAIIVVFILYGFLLYCCVKVGKESEQKYRRLEEEKKKN